MRVLKRTIFGLLSCGALLSVGACGAPKSKGTSEMAAPGERGPGVGLEVAWWVVRRPPPDLAPSQSGPVSPGFRSILSRYSRREVSVSRTTLETWRTNGWRVIAVPMNEVETLRKQLSLVGPVHQQWLGQTTTWVEVARGPQWVRPVVVATDQGTLRLERGAVRLLLRTWGAPGSAERASDATKRLAGSVQVEIVPQHVNAETRPNQAERLLEPTAAGDVWSRGAVFERLGLQAMLDGQDALVLVPERPDVAWDHDRLDAGAFEGVDSMESVSAAGPPIPPLPSLGEAMFVDQSDLGVDAARVLIVLMPRAPKEFRLLGP